MSEKIITPEHWLIITNPKAGKRKFREQSGYVLSEFEKREIPYSFKATEYSGHAIEIVKQYTKLACKNFLILGGDGTVSEVIQGIFAARIDDTTDIRIALLPRGTGNDWGRFWGLKKDYKKSMQVLLQGKTRQIDIGKADYIAGNKPVSRYFINSIGFGLDAEVVDTTHRMKKYFGSFSLLYTLALLIAIIKYKSTDVRLQIDDEEFLTNLYTMNIANGPYSGGGIKQNPAALPYDGIFDMMFVERPTFKDIATALPNIFNGKLSQHPVIKTFRAKEICINSEKEIIVEADGIIIPHAHNCTITILPSAIRMVIP